MAEIGIKRIIKGIVVSDKMDKTIIVKSERMIKHPVFQKYVRRHKKYKAHDEDNQCRVGDKVVIIESRPLSKDKRWRMLEITQKAK
ncbi:MAG TPA: 30S ribosomal protein S17 [Deltaproteobacteria bacterium]|nr:30S ribosomal protein S17 [Deltaproteobacteria bacterium]